MKHPRKQSCASAEAGGTCSGLRWGREHFPHGSLGQEPNLHQLVHPLVMLWLFPAIRDMSALPDCVDQEEDPQRKQLVAPSTFALL